MTALIAVVEFIRRAVEGTAVGSVPRASMVPLTSVGMVLTAGAIFLMSPSRGVASRRVGRLAASAAATIGLAVGAWYAAGWAAVAPAMRARPWWMQRPGLLTALGFVLIGSALFALGSPHPRVRRWASAGAAATLVVALTGLVGHAYGATMLYGLNRWGGTALPTAIAMGLVALGTLSVDPTSGFVAMVRSDTSAGRLLRRLTPAAIIAPVLFGWVALKTYERDLLEAGFAAALVVVLVVVLLVGLATHQAMMVHASDRARERAHAREREARAEAERRRAELERVTESRAYLMRGFSHDVKNPLGAANGYAALLEEGIGGPLTEAQQRSVQRIRRSIQTSLRLIDDLLELAKAEAGQIELRVERVDASALAREVAEDFRGQLDTAGLTLEVHATAALPMESDPARVRQVLGNLVSNACKYTTRGGVTVASSRRVDDGAPRPGEWVAISVTDTGPGIPPEKRETIFREFTRLDPDSPHGAGVGLAISRRIACLLGGDVTVESEVGHGSTFTLWLPVSSASGRRP